MFSLHQKLLENTNAIALVRVCLMGQFEQTTFLAIYICNEHRSPVINLQNIISNLEFDANLSYYASVLHRIEITFSKIWDKALFTEILISEKY